MKLGKLTKSLLWHWLAGISLAGFVAIIGGLSLEMFIWACLAINFAFSCISIENYIISLREEKEELRRCLDAALLEIKKNETG